MVGGEYDARDDSGVVRCGEEREREFRTILESSSQDTIFLFRPLYEFLRQEKANNL